MIKRDILSWWFRPRFLQPWGKKSSTLFAGPFMGEFGWEIMNWQPFLRWLAPQYEKVIVCCRPGSEALYGDFCKDFVIHQIKGTAECNWAHQIVKDEKWSLVHVQVPQYADHLYTVGWQPPSRKKFIALGTTQSDLACDILIHPRGRGFGTNRNWDEKNWNFILKELNQSQIKVGVIGLKSATCNVEGEYIDFRDQPLSDTLNILASAKLVVGPSSGPMHLASLCKTPHLVWTDLQKYARGHRSRDKYLHHWNPFQTRAIVMDEFGFNPPPEKILEAILLFLQNSSMNREK